MNKRYLVVGAALAMLALVACAFALDCVRLADAARQRVELADDEVTKQERRLIKLLNGSNEISPEVQSAIKAYDASAGPAERRESYDALVAAFRQTMNQDVDPTDPLARKFMDDAAGAMNRREVAEPIYDAEWAEYREYLGSARGAVARRFSAAARAGWEAE